MALTVESARKMIEQPMEKMEQISPTTYRGSLIAAFAASCLLFLTGRRQWALFVGVWAPVILNLRHNIGQHPGS